MMEESRPNTSRVELTPGGVQDEPLEVKNQPSEQAASHAGRSAVIGPVGTFQNPPRLYSPCTSAGWCEGASQGKIPSRQRFSGPECFADAGGQRTKGR